MLLAAVSSSSRGEQEPQTIGEIRMADPLPSSSGQQGKGRSLEREPGPSPAIGDNAGITFFGFRKGPEGLEADGRARSRR